MTLPVPNQDTKKRVCSSSTQLELGPAARVHTGKIGLMMSIPMLVIKYSSNLILLHVVVYYTDGLERQSLSNERDLEWHQRDIQTMYHWMTVLMDAVIMKHAVARHVYTHTQWAGYHLPLDTIERLITVLKCLNMNNRFKLWMPYIKVIVQNFYNKCLRIIMLSHQIIFSSTISYAQHKTQNK